MTNVEIVGDKLVMTIEGIDVVLSFKKSLEVPLDRVKRATVGVTAEAQARLDESIRLPGAYMPGIAIAGRFYRHGDWVFWNIHDGRRAITIDVQHEGYVSLVVEVEDPIKTVGQIDAALAARAR
ncbi:MAG: hypothetical protein IT374_14010 [Polyangiaceae bacterium]|nr:hypothetical protein [Polyangiaceae bacterium]